MGKKPVKKFTDDMLENLANVSEVLLQDVYSEYNDLDLSPEIKEEDQILKLNSEFSPKNLEYLFGFLAVQETPLLPDVMSDMNLLKKNLKCLQENI